MSKQLTSLEFEHEFDHNFTDLNRDELNLVKNKFKLPSLKVSGEYQDEIWELKTDSSAKDLFDVEYLT